MSIIVGILLMAVLTGCFIGSYVLNKRTPVPEGTEIVHCRSCTIKSCGNYGKN